MQCTCAILSSVACPAVQNFSIFSHKRHGLEKEPLNVKCVSSFFTTLSEIFFILRKIERDMMEMYIAFHVKYCLFLSDFN